MTYNHVFDLGQLLFLENIKLQECNDNELSIVELENAAKSQASSDSTIYLKDAKALNRRNYKKSLQSNTAVP